MFCTLCSGNFPKALEWYSKSLRLCEDGRAYGNRAQCLINLAHAKAWNGDTGFAVKTVYERAKGDAIQAMRLLPTQAKNYIRCAFSHMGAGDFPRALSVLRDGLRKCPRSGAIQGCIADLVTNGVKDQMAPFGSNPVCMWHSPPSPSTHSYTHSHPHSTHVKREKPTVCVVQTQERYQRLAWRDHQKEMELGHAGPIGKSCGWCYCVIPEEFQSTATCVMCCSSWREKDAAQTIRDKYLRLPRYATGWGFLIPGREIPAEGS